MVLLANMMSRNLPNIVWEGTILDRNFWIAIIRVGIFWWEFSRWEFSRWELSWVGISGWELPWVGIVRVGVILGGNYPGGSYAGREFSLVGVFRVGIFRLGVFLVPVFWRRYIFFSGMKLTALVLKYFVTRNYSIIIITHYKVQIMKKLYRKVRKYRADRYLLLLFITKYGKISWNI